jgi:hypothetical protein
MKKEQVRLCEMFVTIIACVPEQSFLCLPGVKSELAGLTLAQEASLKGRNGKK